MRRLWPPSCWSFLDSKHGPIAVLQEPKTGVRSALSDCHGVHLMYVAEICPAAKTAVEAFESKYIPENECVGGEKDNCAGDIEMAPLRGFIQRASFTGLRKEWTVVNGKTICQVSEDIEKDQENMPTETQEAPM